MLVNCGKKIAPNCRGDNYHMRKASFRKHMETYGTCICKACSSVLKNKKNSIPNDYFKHINTEEKAYFLGLFLSDGSFVKSVYRVDITLKAIDHLLLKDLSTALFNEDISKISKDGSVVYLRFNSKEICEDLAKHLNTEVDKKSFSVRYPSSMEEVLKWSFLRGVFDGDGYISNPEGKGRMRRPRVEIASCSEGFKNDLVSLFPQYKWRKDSKRLSLGVSDSENFLANIYNSASIKLERKHTRYLAWQGLSIDKLGGTKNG